jgi:hypothetical protein
VSQGIRIDEETQCFDSGPTPLIRRLTYNADTGAVIGVPTFHDPISGAVVAPTGLTIECPGITGSVAPEAFEILRDDSGLFVRQWQYDPLTGQVTGFQDVELDGTTAHVTTGFVVEDDYELERLCDTDGAGNVTNFNRGFDAAGRVVGDFDLNGVPYVVVGTVGACGSDTYRTSVVDLPAGGGPTVIAPLGNLVSWTVRHRDSAAVSGATLDVNGTVASLDDFEVISSGGIEESPSLLDDTLTINPGATGNGVRVTLLRRI